MNPPRRWARALRRLGPLVTVLSGNAIFMATQWAVLVLLIRVGETEIAGEYVLATTIATPLFLFASLKLRPAFVADAAAGSRYEAYRRVRLTTTSIAAAASIGVGCVWMGVGSAWILLAVVVAKCAEAICDLHYAVMQRARDFTRFSASLAVRGLLGVVALAAALASGASPAVALWLWSASWWAVLVLRDRRSTVPAGLGPWMEQAPGRLALRLLPLGAAAFAVALSSSLPRLAVEHYLGLADLGAFGAVLMVYTAALFALEASSDVLIGPLAAAHGRSDLTLIRRVIGVSVVVGLLVALLGVSASRLVGEPILVMLYGEQLTGYDDALMVLAGAVGLHVIVAVTRTGVLAAGAFRDRLATEIAALVVAVTGSVLLVPRYGVLGAAWAVALTAAAQCLWSLWQSWRLLREPGRLVPTPRWAVIEDRVAT